MRKQDYITLAGIAIVCIVCSLIPERPIDPDIHVVKGFWGAIIGAAFQAVGAVAANARQNKAIQGQRKVLGQQMAEDRAEMNANYLDRADSQAVLREVREQNKEQMASLNTEGVKRGMTDEAKIAAAGQLNKAYANVVSRLGAVGAQYRDRARERMRGTQQQMAGLEYNTAMAQAKGIGDAASLASTSVNDVWEAVAAKRNIGK
jgi:hypothetical protein